MRAMLAISWLLLVAPLHAQRTDFTFRLEQDNDAFTNPSNVIAVTIWQKSDLSVSLSNSMKVITVVVRVPITSAKGFFVGTTERIDPKDPLFMPLTPVYLVEAAASKIPTAGSKTGKLMVAPKKRSVVPPPLPTL